MIQGFVLAALVATAAAVAAPEAVKPATAEIERRGSYGYQPPSYGGDSGDNSYGEDTYYEMTCADWEGDCPSNNYTWRYTRSYSSYKTCQDDADCTYRCCKKQKCRRPKPVYHKKPAYTPPPAYGSDNNSY